MLIGITLMFTTSCDDDVVDGIITSNIIGDWTLESAPMDVLIMEFIDGLYARS